MVAPYVGRMYLARQHSAESAQATFLGLPHFLKLNFVFLREPSGSVDHPAMITYASRHRLKLACAVNDECNIATDNPNGPVT